MKYMPDILIVLIALIGAVVLFKIAYRAIKAGEFNNRSICPLVSVKAEPLRFWIYWSALFVIGLTGLTMAIWFILDLMGMNL